MNPSITTWYRKQRIPASWLGILATLVMYIAPLISQTIQLSDREIRHRVVADAMCRAHPLPVVPQVTVVPAAPAIQHHAAGPGMEQDACGYCTLLGHLSWLAVIPHEPVDHGPSPALRTKEARPFVVVPRYYSLSLPRAPPATA